MRLGVEYRIRARKALSGLRQHRYVTLERTLRVDGKAQSVFSVQLAVDDALALVRAYREGMDGRFVDVLDGGREVAVEMVPCESFTLGWHYGKVRAHDSLWSDWAGPFMDEVERAAREALE